jgi:hypothetical protein
MRETTTNRGPSQTCTRESQQYVPVSAMGPWGVGGLGLSSIAFGLVRLPLPAGS